MPYRLKDASQAYAPGALKMVDIETREGTGRTCPENSHGPQGRILNPKDKNNPLRFPQGVQSITPEHSSGRFLPFS